MLAHLFLCLSKNQRTTNWIDVATQPCISCWNNHVGNLFKMAFLTYSPLLICHVMGDLRKPHHGSHASDPMHQPVKIVIAKILKCYKTALHETSNTIGQNTYLSYLIYSWHKGHSHGTCNGFSQISHTMIY